MIYSCALYNGEKSLLKIRLEEAKRMDPISKWMPVTHVLIESTHTFTGIPKPITFRLGDWPEYPIEFFAYHEEPKKDPWENETRTRNYIKECLQMLRVQDDDIIILSDLDEIPRSYAIQHYRKEFGLVALQMDIYCYYLNTLSERQVWRQARIMTWDYLKDKTPDEVRRAGFDLALMNSGWHFTYQGGVATILNKYKSFSHQEESVQKFANRELLLAMMAKLDSPWGKTLETIGLDDLPLYVQTYKQEFKDMLL